MKKLLPLVLLIIIIVAGCGKSGNFMMASEDNSRADNYASDYDGSYKYDEAEATTSSNLPNEEYGELDYASIPQERMKSGGSPISEGEVKIPEKIIKTAEIQIEVEEYVKSIVKVKEAVTKWKGYVSNENEVNNTYKSGNTLIIRVLSENFDQLVNELVTGEDKIVSKSVNSMDVSEEYMDIVTRLKNKQETEKQYIELLKRANSIEEILRVNEYVRTLREEIEATEGRLKYLNDKVAYSTITLELYQYNEDWMEPTFGENADEALETGWEGFKGFIIGILFIWPFWSFLIISLVVLILLLKRGKKRRKKALQNKEEEKS